MEEERLSVNTVRENLDVTRRATLSQHDFKPMERRILENREQEETREIYRGL